MANTRNAPLPIVALGASAGGLEALQTFFKAMPAHSGLAFVVVTHQHPGHVSLMAELLGRRTEMPVIEVSSETQIRPNHVYTSRPGHNLAIHQDRLFCMAPDEQGPLHLPIDFFFRSLALDHKHLAVGIILSGTGSDGALGVKEIKGALGMVMVQDEESAEYAGMPRSAIRTGSVDYVLAVEDMPEKLMQYASRIDQYGSRIDVAPPTVDVEPESEPEAYRRLFVLLRTQTGHDFSGYKKSTMQRRIERRMNLHDVDTLSDYLDLLQSLPAEVSLLFKELLISVTSFFRDPQAFEALRSALSERLETSPPDRTFRVWVAGCSTGEEAYSIAIVLRELALERSQRLEMQVFATDLDETAIQTARTGIYPLGIANDVSPERLARFFTHEEDSYRLRSEIREMVIFATHNLVEDPPFTKLDLVSCRNLFIYLKSELQKKLIPLFHYALLPGGVLFLGPAESAASHTGLFTVIDSKWKIFERIETAHDQSRARPELPTHAPHVGAPIVRPSPASQERRSNHAALAEKLLLRTLVPPAVLVTERGDVVHIHGRTGSFLEPAPGPQTSANIFNMARHGLELRLAAAVRHAAALKEQVLHRDVLVRNNGDAVFVDLRVQPITEPESLRGLLLISFEEAREPRDSELSEAELPADQSARLTELERALQYTKESHQGTIEELETANEELKSTNEELQSTNEELQSTNEELETSKEEMQSLNEELQMVNAELQDKVEELSHINDDMRNLLNATDIATIFLDAELRIKRYTEQAKKVMHFIPSDIGRSISDLASNLAYDRLVEDAEEVMRTLVPKEAEVQSDANHWYLMRILPYRTNENYIDGLVLTFVDISMTKALQENERRLFETLEGSPTMVFRQDVDLRFTWACSKIFGRNPEEVLGKTDGDLFGMEEVEEVIAVKRSVLQSGKATRQRSSLIVDGESRLYDLFVEPLRDTEGTIIGISCIMTDLTGLD